MYVYIYITHLGLVWLLLDIHAFSTDTVVGTYVLQNKTKQKQPTCNYKVLQ